MPFVGGDKLRSAGDSHLWEAIAVATGPQRYREARKVSLESGKHLRSDYKNCLLGVQNGMSYKLPVLFFSISSGQDQGWS